MDHEGEAARVEPGAPEAVVEQVAVVGLVAPVTPLEIPLPAAASALAVALIAPVTPEAAAAPAASATQGEIALLVVDGVSGEISSARIRCPNCKQYVNKGLAVHYIALWGMTATDIQKELRDRVFKHVDCGCSNANKNQTRLAGARRHKD
jgi:hypothetical protein